jgi:hypothetical protein
MHKISVNISQLMPQKSRPISPSLCCLNIYATFIECVIVNEQTKTNPREDFIDVLQGLAANIELIKVYCFILAQSIYVDAKQARRLIVMSANRTRFAPGK